METEGFFRRTETGYEPLPHCRGPWGPTTLHGRVVAGLLAYEAETKHGDEAFRVARMTIDLYRMPVFAPIEMRSSVVRTAGRIKVVDVEFINGGEPAARASVIFLRASETPEGEVWTAQGWDAPKPETLEPQAPPPERTDWVPMWETRLIRGGFGTVGQKSIWMREIRPLVEGEPLTPFQRVAVAADFSSPLANSGSKGLEYINVDITLYLNRYPSTEWVGFDATAHHADEGIAVGECMLYDEQGAIGRSIVAALANKRRD